MTSTRRDPLVGGVVDGRYEVLSRLARGGMSTVYRALDTRLDREVALKVMHAHLAEDPALVGRFEREAKTAARLSHPHVVSVLDQGHTRDADGDVIAYLVMEYVPGTTLRDVIAREAPLTPREALLLLTPVVDGLAAAHREGLVHRDVKPENVLVREDGRVTVADFGLSRATTNHTSAGQALVGTPAYLAPEHIRGDDADARSDVYAVGILLFELLTGRQPYTAPSPLQVAYRHLHERVPVPSSLVPGLAEPLDDLVLWCTEPDPADRPADAVALLAELRRLSTTLGESELDRRPSPGAPRAPRHASDRSALPGDVGTPARGSTPGRGGPGDDETRVLGSATAPTQGPTKAGTPVSAPPATAVLGMPRSGAVSPDHGPLHTPLHAPLHTAAAPRAGRASGARADRRAARRPEVVLGRGSGRTAAIGAAVTLLLTGVALLLGWSMGASGTPFGVLGAAVVPDLTGVSEAAAQQRLSAEGVLVRVTSAHDERFSDGTVTAVQPAPGTRVHRGSPVELTVSAGPAPVPAPDLVGSTVSDMFDLARSGRVRAEVAGRRTDRHVPAGSVLAQTPAPGQDAVPGSVVRVVLSQGPARHAVPELGGLTASEARAALRALGFEPRLHAPPLGDLLTREPRVVRQSSPAGTTLGEGTVVELWTV